MLQDVVLHGRHVGRPDPVLRCRADEALRWKPCSQYGALWHLQVLDPSPEGYTCSTCAESSFLTPEVSPRSCEWMLDKMTRMSDDVPCRHKDRA